MNEQIPLRYVDLMPTFRIVWRAGAAYVEIPPPHNHKLRRCVPAGMDGDKVMAEGRRRLDELLRVHKAGQAKWDGMGRMTTPTTLVPLGTWRYVMGERVRGWIIEVDKE